MKAYRITLDSTDLFTDPTIIVIVAINPVQALALLEIGQCVDRNIHIEYIGNVAAIQQRLE